MSLGTDATSTSATCSCKRTAVILALLFLVALALDIPVSNWVHQIGLSEWMKDRTHAENQMLRFFGIFWYSTLPIALIFLFVRKYKDAAIILLSGIYSIANQPIKWIVGRYRPFKDGGAFHFHPFLGGLKGLFHAEGPLSFPSGDTTLAFAMAVCLTWAAPRLKMVWFALGIWIALERIAEGAHYPSDTVAGAALGICMAILARKTVEKYLADREGQAIHGQ